MDIKFMQMAIDLAKKSAEEGEVPVGAVVVCNGNIEPFNPENMKMSATADENGLFVAGTGRNRRETSKNALHHAEIEAINEACQNLGGWRLWRCDLYVTLEPCPMCAGAIINARIKNVYFGASDKKAGSFGSVVDFNNLNYNFKPNVEGGICEKECSDLLTSFFENLR